MNVNPYDARGEEIQTRFEDDYKFHRYTNVYENAFGNPYYTLGITCRSIFTDPDIHEKLHETHYEVNARYHGYWYREDLFAYDPQHEAVKANAFIESSLVGAWLCFTFWIAGLTTILIQKYKMKKKQIEVDRISMHSTMLGSNCESIIGSQFRKEGSIRGSIMSGRSSSFQRAGSLRESERLNRSRRDIDDIALNAILKTPTLSRSQTSSYTPQQNSQTADNTLINSMSYGSSYQPSSSIGSTTTHHYPGQSIPIRTRGDATYLSRDEVETEIF